MSSIYERFDVTNSEYIRAAVGIVIEGLEERLGFKFAVAVESYDPANLKLSLAAKLNDNTPIDNSLNIPKQNAQASVPGAYDAVEKAKFNNLCYVYGFLPEDYGKTFKSSKNGNALRIVGFNTRAPKNPIKLVDVNHPTKEYKAGPEYVLRMIGRPIKK